MWLQQLIMEGIIEIIFTIELKEMEDQAMQVFGEICEILKFGGVY